METIELLLPLNLQFFAEGGEGEGGEESSTTTDTSNEGKEEKGGEKEIMIPKSRFDEVNESYKEMKKQFDEFQSAQSKAEQERQAKEQEDAEKKGEFEGLYNKAKNDVETFKNESKQAKARIESLEGVIQGLLEAKLETIDKDYHDLIPEGMTPEQKLAWVSNAESKGIFGKRQTNTPLGEQTNPKGNEEVDINKLNPLQMLMSGYGNK